MFIALHMYIDAHMRLNTSIEKDITYTNGTEHLSSQAMKSSTI